jgi:hypothetical protein
MNKEFLKMQKLAGLITEGQYKSKINEAEDQSLGDIAEKISQYLKSNGYESMVAVDGKKTGGDVNSPFQIYAKTSDGTIIVDGSAPDQKAVKDEMTQLQKWILDNFDSLEKVQDVRVGDKPMGQNYNGKFVVKLSSNKTQLNEEKIPFFHLSQILKLTGPWSDFLDRGTPAKEQTADLKVGLIVLPKMAYRNESDIKSQLGKITKIEGDKVTIEKVNGEELVRKASDLVHLVDGGYQF